MSGLYFYDDSLARAFEPFALTRPVSELRAGAMLVRERWERVTGLKAEGFIAGAHLTDFDEALAPSSLGQNAEIPAGSVLVNSRCVVSLDESLSSFHQLACDRAVCAVRLARAIPAADLASGKPDIGSLQTSFDGQSVKGRWLKNVWELVAHLADQLPEDIDALGKSLSSLESPTAAVMGDHACFVEEGARVGPYVVFDTTEGPILIESEAEIKPFSHLAGPLFIGRGTIVMGDRVAGSSIGPMCKVKGEISNSIFTGHSNKGHAGFVGHSYLGRWVNLGALTTTSNLKNTYGQMQLWTPRGLADTSQQFLGTFFGDHVKTGIGTMLSTATVLGAGANIFGSQAPPKAVAPFSWGDAEPYDTYDAEKFVAVAERVMARRHVELSERGRKHLLECHRRRWSV